MSLENASPKRIAILFEYGTLNGGERSMLSVVGRLCGEPSGGIRPESGRSLIPSSPIDLAEHQIKGRGSFDFTAIVAAPGPLSGALDELGIPIEPLTMRDHSGKRLHQDQVLANLTEIVRRISPQFVHANSLAMGRLTGALKPQLLVPTVAHLRDILNVSQAAMDDLNRNDRLIAVSHATRDFHMSRGMNAEKVQVLYNGVDGDLFQPRPSTGFLKRELNLSEDSLLGATIGQIGLRKGHDVLAEAAVRVADELPNLHYIVVGERLSQKTESIEFEQALEQTFKNAGIGDRLHRLGYRDDVPSLLNEVDLLIHPAKQEPLGRVLLEAAASGVSVIATDVGGTREIFPDQSSAVLIPPDNAAALADAILGVAQDPAAAARRGACARQRVVKHFSANQAASNLAVFWQQLLNSGEHD